MASGDNASAIMTSEGVLALARELTTYVAERASTLRKLNSTRVFRSQPEEAKRMETAFFEDLVQQLEDEVVVAVPSPDGSIRADELNEEVLKRALVSLKVPVLRRIADSKNLKKGGNAEDLAARIAQRYRWNADEITALVLANEDQPTESRSFVDRLYPLETLDDDLERAYGRVVPLVGRYIRVGLARWYVFESAELEEGNRRLQISGRLRAYDARLAGVGDDQKVVPVARSGLETPTLTSIDADSSMMRISGGGHVEGQAAAAAVTLATGTKTLTPGWAPRGVNKVTGSAIGFAAETLFLLDLLTARLPSHGLRVRNLTVAKFRMTHTTDDEDTARPVLRAVRLEGRHLMDSPAACRLAAIEGRELLDITASVELEGSSGSIAPVRFSIDRDHAVTMTGFGAIASESFEVHRLSLAAMGEEMSDGILDPAALTELCQRILDRAVQRDEVAEATILVTDEVED
jgi:hypothetical protein